MSSPVDPALVKAFFSASEVREFFLSQPETSAGVYAKISKKGILPATLTYQQILDEALCCGWIDSVKKGLDETHWLQRFSQRKKKSVWSQVNKNRVLELEAEGRMLAPGLEAVRAAMETGAWERAYAGSAEMEIPADFLTELEKNSVAQAFFTTLNRTNLYFIYFRVLNAKSTASRAKKIAEIVWQLERRELFFG